ncbi:NlpC/P60 family protein [Pokkaliibacter sp. CJK22405]|uniref:NlpC/P60 family protein n=1 Tax=Pokkaliibacter sp. CJK22405 TaxID=3384615 RepID=UPI003984B880
MFEEYAEQIRSMALEAFPREGILLITQQNAFVAENVHPEPELAFQARAADMNRAQAEGLMAVVHSHPNGPDCPSADDMRGQLSTAVPWGIVSCYDGERCGQPFWWGEGVPVPPLIGRGFRHGVTDCYSLIRDYYAQELSITLPEFPRDWEWWQKGETLYLDGLEHADFVPVSAAEIAPGDMFYCTIRSKTPNHGGVYLGDGLALHHLTGRHAVDASQLSCREPIHRWMSHITHVFRHRTRL